MLGLVVEDRLVVGLVEAGLAVQVGLAPACT